MSAISFAWITIGALLLGLIAPGKAERTETDDTAPRAHGGRSP